MQCKKILRMILPRLAWRQIFSKACTLDCKKGLFPRVYNTLASFSDINFITVSHDYELIQVNSNSFMHEPDLNCSQGTCMLKVTFGYFMYPMYLMYINKNYTPS